MLFSFLEARISVSDALNFFSDAHFDTHFDMGFNLWCVTDVGAAGKRLRCSVHASGKSRDDVSRRKQLRASVRPKLRGVPNLPVHLHDASLFAFVATANHLADVHEGDEPVLQPGHPGLRSGAVLSLGRRNQLPAFLRLGFRR